MTGSEIIIGVDLGGTKIMTGAINRSGAVLGVPVKISTQGNDSADNIFGRIVSSVERVLTNLGISIKQVKGIGVGATGPLDLEKGLILECPQLPNMHFFNLREAVKDHFGIPVSLNNDANCLILGESVYGAGARAKSILGFTLGTGIGGAIVMNKKIWNGATGTAAEVWKSPYKEAVIEDYVSGAGVAKIYQSLSGIEKSSEDIFHLAQSGEKHALQTWKEFGGNLAIAVSWGINFIDPELVILGGSVSNAYPFFRESMENKLKEFICNEPLQKTKVVTGQLGEHAGFIGAACLVMG